VLVRFALLGEQVIRVHRAWAAARRAPELIMRGCCRACGRTMRAMELLKWEGGWTIDVPQPGAAAPSRCMLSETKYALGAAYCRCGLGPGRKHRQAAAGQRHGQAACGQPSSSSRKIDPPQLCNFDLSGLVGQTQLLPSILQQLPGYGTGWDSNAGV
jgi:hypothetical protein